MSAMISGQSSDAIVGRWLRRIGSALIAMAIAIFVTLYGLRIPLDVGAHLYGMAFGFLGAFLAYRAQLYLVRSERADRLKDQQPPVVLLRPFQTDTRALWSERPDFPFGSFSGGPTFEEQLAEVVRPIGQLMALGEPGEAFAPPGAARFSETHETWKSRVVDLLRRARLVILIPGTSEALRWEITTAFQELKPQQLLILLVTTNSGRDYEALSRVLKEATGRELPESSGIEDWRARILQLWRRLEASSPDVGVHLHYGITFDEGWTARILQLRAPLWRSLIRLGGAPSSVHLHYGLQPIFRANGIQWSPLPVSKEIAIFGFEAILFALFIMGIIGPN